MLYPKPQCSKLSNANDHHVSCICLSPETRTSATSTVLKCGPKYLESKPQNLQDLENPTQNTNFCKGNQRNKKAGRY